MSVNERAYELLRWQSRTPLEGFDETFPYFDVWKAYSDKDLDEWDRDHPFETNPELAAFHELERLGVFTQKDFYSPSKAKNGHYTKRLKQHVQLRARRQAGGKQESVRVAPTRRYRGGGNQRSDYF